MRQNAAIRRRKCLGSEKHVEKLRKSKLFLSCLSNHKESCHEIKILIWPNATTERESEKHIYNA